MKLRNLRLSWLIVGCLFHASVITGLWLLMFRLDIDLIPGKLWMILGLLWPLWMLAALVPPRIDILRRVLVAGLGLLILIPAIPTLYTFVVWTIEGFAP